MLPCLLSLTLGAGLLLGAAPGQPDLQLEVALQLAQPRMQVLLGEPAYVIATVRNPTEASLEYPPVWRWHPNWRRWGQVETVCPVDVWQDEAWRPMPVAWHRRDPWRLETGWPDVVLGPQQSFIVYWNLLWDYDLTPGRYRTRFDLPLWNGDDWERWGKPEDEVETVARVRSDWHEFQVLDPQGRDLEVYQRYHLPPGDERLPNPQDSDRTSWLRHEDADYSGSRYEFWHLYALIDNHVNPPMWPVWPPPELPTWLDHALAAATEEPPANGEQIGQAALFRRLNLVRTLVRTQQALETLDHAAAPTELFALLQAPLQALQASPDLEWSYPVANSLALLTGDWAMFSYYEHHPPAGGGRPEWVNHPWVSFERHWRLPWYAHPPDERPTFDDLSDLWPPEVLADLTAAP